MLTVYKTTSVAVRLCSYQPYQKSQFLSEAFISRAASWRRLDGFGSLPEHTRPRVKEYNALPEAFLKLTSGPLIANGFSSSKLYMMGSSDDNLPGFISPRAMRALQPALSYGKAFNDARSRLWSPEDPQGNILCSIAENNLTCDMLHDKLVAVMRDVPVDQMAYPNGCLGFPEARKAMARMAQRTFMKGLQIDPGHLAILTGAGAVLELLFHTLCSAGSGVMLPRPIYPAFLNDMEVRSGCVPVLFELIEPESDDDATTPSIQQQLSNAAAAAEAAGTPVRVFLLTNPNNPMGIIYKRNTVLSILKWCLETKRHFISDEIYANSVWGEGGPGFVSAEIIAAEAAAEGEIKGAELELQRQLLHTVFGLSKDFCASGLRVGVVHTRNQTVLQVIDNLSYFHTVSNHSLWAVSKVLEDDAFVDQFLAENRKRMKESYKGLSDALAAANIPHIHATAAMFCWIDLRAGLLQPGWDGERELWEALVKAGVLITPGEACRASEPGFFRICWAWVPAAALPEMVRRIAALLADRAQQTAEAD